MRYLHHSDQIYADLRSNPSQKSDINTVGKFQHNFGKKNIHPSTGY